jgi:hypothetical protein
MCWGVAVYAKQAFGVSIMATPAFLVDSWIYAGDSLSMLSKSLVYILWLHLMHHDTKSAVLKDTVYPAPAFNIIPADLFLVKGFTDGTLWLLESRSCLRVVPLMGASSMLRHGMKRSRRSENRSTILSVFWVLAISFFLLEPGATVLIVWTAFTSQSCEVFFLLSVMANRFSVKEQGKKTGYFQVL